MRANGLTVVTLLASWIFNGGASVAGAGQIIVPQNQQIAGRRFVPAPYTSNSYSPVSYVQQPQLGTEYRTDVNPESRIQSLESAVRNLEFELNNSRQSSARNGAENVACQSCGQSLAVCSGICEMAPRKAGFNAGVTLLFAKPHFKEAFQVSNINNLTGVMTLVPFEYDYELSPRVWFGFQNEQGLGLRASYWSFDGQGLARNLTTDGSEIWGAHVVNTMFPSNIFAAIPGSQMSVSDYLTTQTVNLVGTYNLEVAAAQILAGAGLRYAKLEQGFAATVQSPVLADFHQLTWSRVFEGLGPTFTVDAKKRLGQSRFSAVASGGAALLYGSKTLSRTVINDQTPAGQASPFLQLNDADEVVGIGEMNLGLEWGTFLPSGHQALLRGVYEGQLWAEAGAPTLGFLGFQGFGLQMELKR